MAASQQPVRPVADATTPIVVKVTRDGVTHKTKMVLKDMIYPNFEYQLRNMMMIGPGQNMVLERYSDSTGAYVRLEPPPSTTYKQLYRAAKAKQKLKLRVTADTPSQPMEPKIEKPSSTESPAAPPAVPEQVDPLQKHLEGLEETLRKHGLSPAIIGTPDVSPNPAPTPESQPEPVGPAYRILSTLEPTSQPPNKASATHRAETQVSLCPGMLGAYTVCCNSCEKMVADVHYHCGTCDDGDFDLCSDCIDQGITCHSPSHWMTKRTIVNGQFVDSVTRKVPSKKPSPSLATAPAPALEKSIGLDTTFRLPAGYTRTCNCCLIELPERDFIHCNDCEDYDLCQTCFLKDSHGHHPKHGFAPAVEGVEMSRALTVRMAAGRNQSHNAICDGCDKFIAGVRHKCLECPDFDYCSTCIPHSPLKHPRHRFAPIYDALPEILHPTGYVTHMGICCDGPLCQKTSSFIRGVRYKCSICHDTDFCGNCEASPHNKHNKTHPLIMIKTPLRHVSVSTTEEKPTRHSIFGDEEAQAISPPGQVFAPSSNGPTDQGRAEIARLSARLAETEKQRDDALEALVHQQEIAEELERECKRNKKQLVQMRRTDLGTMNLNTSATPIAHASTGSSYPVKIEAPAMAASSLPIRVAKQPDLAQPVASEQSKPEAVKAKPASTKADGGDIDEQNLSAAFVKDTVVDGTIMPQNHMFEQTWTLRNSGSAAWPSGCAVKFVGGDYMGRVDSNHPAQVSLLDQAAESSACDHDIIPGETATFKILLRTPHRTGKFVSYWRLTSPSGVKFGDRLWCDVAVRAIRTEESEAEPKEPETAETKPVTKQAAVEDAPEKEDPSQASSTMIFPKLEKESPEASVHEAAAPAPSSVPDDKSSIAGIEEGSVEEDGDWDVNEGSFLTDDEYDILDASDEDIPEDLHNRHRLA